MLAKGIVTIIHWLLIQLCFLHIHKLHMNDNKVGRVLISLKSHCCHLFLLLDVFPQTSYKSTNASSSTNTELFSEGCVHSQGMKTRALRVPWQQNEDSTSFQYFYYFNHLSVTFSKKPSLTQQTTSERPVT